MNDPDATIIRPPRGADPDATVIRPRMAPDRDPTVVRPAGRTSALPVPAAPPLPKAPPLALQPGFRLHEYRIDSVLGQGGFGITYLATDVHLNAMVAIKEYLPEEIAFRTGERSVSPNASRHRDRYRQGLENFLVEARTLATFRHPAIVRVARFFEAHQTAYMVLEYEQGAPFRVWWPRQQGGLGEAGLVALLLPLLDGLAAVHAAGFLHRDIKPDNIQVRSADGSLVLLDFGSAGQTLALADQAAVAVTPGYSPIEQYGLGEQGAWTDLYALAATLYWAVTGRKPPDAETRAANPGAFVPAVEAGRDRCGPAFLAAIDWALDTDPARRPRNVAEFRRALCADHVASLGLQEALQRGDTVIDGAEPGAAPRPRRRRRAGAAWQRLLAPRDWPLAVKMALAMVITALLPMALTSAYNLSGSLQAVADGELRYVQQMAHGTAARLAQFVADNRHMARALATDPDFPAFLDAPADSAGPALRDRLVRLAAADPDVQSIMLLDAQGQAVLASDAQLKDRSFSVHHFFQEAMQGRAHTTGIVVGAVAGAAGMFHAEPVRADDGRVLGAMVLGVEGSSLAVILDEVRHDSTLTPLLVDGDGVVIHHPREDLLYRSLVPLSAQRLQAIRADQRFRRDDIASLGETGLAGAVLGATAGGTVSYDSKVTGREEIAGYAPVPGLDWVVAVTEPRATFEAPLNTLYSHLLWSVALAGLLFTGLGLRFARSIVRPIRALTDAADALKAGDFDAAGVRVDSRDEVGQLGRTFNVMIDVLRQRERERHREGSRDPSPERPRA